MDTVVRTRRSFDWPTDVLRGLDLSLEDVEVLAFTGSGADGAIIPLSFSLGERNAGPLTAVLSSSIDLDRIVLTIQPADGPPDANVSQMVDGRAYIARRPIYFALPELSSGSYKLEWVGTGRAGSVRTSVNVRVAATGAAP